MALVLTVILGIVLLVFAGVAGWMVWKSRPDDPTSQRWLIAALPFCAAALLWMTWINIVRSPYESWNAARTAPAVAWAKGMPLYSPRGVGTATDFIHGPVSAVVRLPAALGSNPTSAIIIADAINAAIFLLPIVAFLHAFRATRLQRAIALLVFWGFSITTQSLDYSQFNVHADAPAVGFALLACACSIAAARTARFLPFLILSSLCAVLSAGSKQNLAPILVVLPLYEWVRHGWRRAAIAALAELVLFSALLAISIYAFGADALLYQTITLPSHHRWFYQDYGRIIACLLQAGFLIQDTAPMVALLAIGCMYFSRLPKRGWRNLRTWIARNPWLLPLAAAIVLIPSSLIGKAKVGGNWNAFTPTTYFLAAALSGLIARYRPRPRDGWNSVRSQLLIGGSCLLCLLLAIEAINPWDKFLQAFRDISHLNENPQQMAYEASLKHPHTLYFPWNPLSTLMSENKYYHFEYAMLDLTVAEEGFTREYYYSGLPDHMQFILFPPRRQSEESLRLLPEFNVRMQAPDLPGWDVYSRNQ